MKVIETSNISKQYRNTTVLDKINLEAGKGEIVGVLGPSGAGKTTLINILTGQIRADSGDAYILETSCVNLDCKTYSKIGIMMDSFGLYERLSVYENLKFYSQIFRISSNRIEYVLNKTGLYGARKTLVQNLSKGMKARLNLARAFLKEAELLFLDEPTSGLDPQTAQHIHGLIEEEKQKGTTVFLTTHNMHEAEKLCDNIALLCDGKIVEYGNPQKICSKYNYMNVIDITLKNGEKISLPNSPKSSDKIKQLVESESIKSIHSSEPNLENVFLLLTGKVLKQ